MNKSLIGLLAAVVATAALVAGCGSSSDTSSTESESSSSITKAEFVKQANSICENSEEEGEAEVEAFLEEEEVNQNEEPSEEVQESLVEEVVTPNISAQLEEIRALGFPEGSDGEEAESIIESAEEDLEEIEEEPSALFNSGTFAQTNKEAREYGLTVCGSEG